LSCRPISSAADLIADPVELLIECLGIDASQVPIVVADHIPLFGEDKVIFFVQSAGLLILLPASGQLVIYPPVLVLQPVDDVIAAAVVAVPERIG